MHHLLVAIMIKILKYLKPYWYLAILAPLFMVFEVLFDLLQPQLLTAIVDDGILSETLAIEDKINIVLTQGGLMLLFLAIGGFCGIMSGVCASIASNNFANDLRKEVFSSVVDLSFEQTDSFTTGSLVTRITNDITQIQDFISMLIRMFIRTLVMFVGGIIFMLLTDKIFALILGCALPIQFIIIFFLLKKITPYFAVLQERVDVVNSVVQENVNGVRVVKAFTQESHEVERFGVANNNLVDVTLKVFTKLMLLGPIIMIILNLVTIAIIYYSGISISGNAELILAGDKTVLTVGKVMRGLTYVSMVLMSVTSFAMIAQNITRAQVSAKRVNEVLSCVPAVNSGEGNFEIKEEDKGTIEFKNVNFSYPNFSSKPIISNLSLKINKGERLAILGATGAGKTSIVNLIPRFYDVTSGEVLVDGVNVKEYKLDDLRDRISPILQRTELFMGSIYDNVRWGKEDATLDDVKEACKIAQADDFISSFDDGYDTFVGERGSTLSGGQKQRIAIARGLIKKPEIMIFDDSTSALDLKTEANLHQALRENLSDTTIIIIAQRVASAKNCDRIAIIDNGQLVDCDTHENLMKNCPIYQDIYNSQLRRGDDNE